MSKNPANNKSTDSEALELENDNEIQLITDKVNELYNFKIHYFENHDINSAFNKTNDIKNELSKVLQCFDDNKVSKLKSNNNRAKYYFLKGKALNILDDYDKLAEEYLSKALKLDPNQIECWNELGECYWKKSDSEEAKNCFTAALNYSKNKKSLRNLSITLRQQPYKSQQERVANIEEGVKLAKEAVQLDPNDGLSWAILGNAHLAHFFSVQQNPTTMKFCMSSYIQAEKDIITNGNSDLYYNKAIALKYEENYLAALEYFNKAHLIDPTWSLPQKEEAQLLSYLERVQELINQRGKLKSKKLSQLLQSLDDKHIKNQHIKWSTSSGPVELEFVPITSLKNGPNDGKAIVGKVVCSVHHESSVAFTFCLVDKSEMCFAVTLYNMAIGKGVIIGDTVCIPTPYLHMINIQYKDKTFSFNSIRVDAPLSLLINGKPFARDQVASIDLKTHMKPE